MPTTAIRRPVVAGAGTMGVTLARIFAQAGYAVTLWNRRTSSLDRAQERIAGDLAVLQEKGLLDESPAAIARCVQKLRVALRDKLLLVTFRTKAEGGEQALSHSEYLAFLRLILDTDCADLLDIEFFTTGADLPKLVEQAHSAGVAVVCSSHDFAKTPPRAELVCRMVQMQQAGADLPKLAVMPQCRTDVLELLAATAEMADLHPGTPVITMSMGALGAVSRLAGETFGSAMTFANPGQASAPGQVSLDIVNEVLDALHL